MTRSAPPRGYYRYSVPLYLASGACVILVSLAVVPLSIVLRHYKLTNKVLEAALIAKKSARTRDMSLASAYVAPSDTGELNQFVRDEFGTTAQCTWFERTVVCSVNSTYKTYAAEDDR